MIQGADRLDQLNEYFFSRIQGEIRKLSEEGTDVINLGMGNPDLPPDPTVIQALNQSATLAENHGYQPYRGHPDFREAISAWMTSWFYTGLDPESEILPLIGSKEGIFHVTMAMVNPGELVAIPELGYPAYKAISEMCGAQVITYPLDKDNQPAWDEMGADVAAAKILWMNYPHMPTGSGPAKDTFSKAVEWGTKTKTLICHDNPYCHILNEQPSSLVQVDGWKETGLELHSLSKSHNMAGWRVGWVVADKEIINRIIKIKSNIDSGMFRGIQDAAVKALQVGTEWYQYLNQVYLERQSRAFELLEALDCEFTDQQSGLFVWGKLKSEQNAEKLSSELLHQKGVFITPGFIFGDKGKNYLRVSLCSSQQRILEAINRIKE